MFKQGWKWIAVLSIAVLTLAFVAGTTLAHGNDVAGEGLNSDGWTMYGEMDQGTLGEMIQHMTEIHSAEVAGEMLQHMNEGGCHGDDHTGMMGAEGMGSGRMGSGFMGAGMMGANTMGQGFGDMMGRIGDGLMGMFDFGAMGGQGMHGGMAR